jgi:hypothetical protein
MITLLKKFLVGYMFSFYSPEKNDSVTLYDYLVKLLNVFTLYQMVNEVKEYIIISLLFILFLLFTRFVTSDTLSSSRPVLNIVLMIWFILEMVFLQIIIKYINQF